MSKLPLAKILPLVLCAALAACPANDGSEPDSTITGDSVLDVLDTVDVAPTEDADADAPPEVEDDADATEVADTEDAQDGDADATDGSDATDAGDAAETSDDGADAADVPDDVPPPETFPMTCTGDADCAVACGSGTCVAGRCSFAAPATGCVVVDEATDTGTCVGSGALYPDSTCLFCNPAVQAEGYTATLLGSSFEGGKAGWIYSNLSGSTAKWGVTQTRAGDGQQSLYFGDPTTGTYDVGQRAWGQAVGPNQVIPDGVEPTLSFLLWLETEETAAYDFLRVLVLGAESPEPVEVWHSDAIGGTTGGEFLPITVDLAGWGGKQIQIVFEFDSVDGLINAYEGAYVDAVRLSTGCCAGAIDCDDANPCTVDACPSIGGACTHTPDPLCCNTDADCDDADSCTFDSCTGFGGTCEHSPKPDCCHDHADCNDDDPCTEDVCNVETEKCGHQPLCCQADADCDDGDKCTVGTCVEEQCSYEFTCCLSDLECNDGEYCTTDQCIDGECVNETANLPGCCSPDILLWNFDDAGADEGWTFDPAVGGVGWQITTAISTTQSAPGVLYYGDPVAQNFQGSGANEGKAVSPPIELPEGYEITLTFKGYTDGESSTSYDKFWLEVKTEADTFQIVSKSDLTNGSWKTVTKDLTYLGGQTIQFVYNFDSVDSISNSGLGMVVDDFELTSTCQPKPCTSASQCPAPDKCTAGVCEGGFCAYVNSCCQSSDECDDGDVCTSDSCTSGQCQFTEIPNCCEGDFECDDKNACTIDYCPTVGGSCQNDTIPGCCLTSGDCDDGEKCTVDTCTDNACDYQWICCASDAECDDGDDVCTVDACVEDFCQFTPTGVDGCCLEETINWDFESPVNFAITETSPPCSWQVTDVGQANSGTQVLYFGNPSSQNFSCSPAPEGEAVSDPIDLFTPGVDYALQFQVYMDTETSTSYDKLWVDVQADGTWYEVWDKSKLGGQDQWNAKTVNLNAFAGKVIAVRFRFDAVDTVANSGLGALIDDVKIVSTCQAMSCTNDSNCNDGFGFSTETCSGGACQYDL